MIISSNKHPDVDINLSEILGSPALRDVGIRFVCAMRKVVSYNDDLTEDEVDMAYEINRAFYSIPQEERDAAHVRQHLPNRPTPTPNRPTPTILPKPEPKVNYATEFTTERCKQLLLLALEKLKAESDTHTFTAIKKEVERLHLQGDRVWAKDDLTLWGQSAKWEGKVQQMLKKLREQDIVAYRSTKSDYFIF